MKCLQVFRPVEGRLYVKTPYRLDNRAWFKELGIRPVREGDYWRVSRTRFKDLIDASVDRFDCADVWTDHYKSQECNESCVNAKGDECVCGCLGINHGGGKYLAGWVPSGFIELADDQVRQFWTVTG